MKIQIQRRLKIRVSSLPVAVVTRHPRSATAPDFTDHIRAKIHHAVVDDGVMGSYNRVNDTDF